MNPLIANVPPSLIRSIAALKQPGDIDFGLGEPTLPPDIEAFEDALEWTRVHGSPYSPNGGFSELRDLIASYLSPGAPALGKLTADNVCVTVGSEEAIYLGIKTVIDATVDEVLIVSPCYLAYPKICMLEGIRHRVVALDSGDGFRPWAATVLDALRPETRMVILNSPSNPTGRIWPREELRALAEGLDRASQPVTVLADEVYRELYFGDSEPDSIARYHPRTLIAGSLSKSNAMTGLRLGWLAGPAEVIAAATKLHGFITTATSTYAQRVALSLFADPQRIGAHRATYATTRERLLSSARAARVDLIEPEGAFYAFLRLPAHLAGNSLDAARSLLLQKRVVAVPGLAFGDSGEGWLRISWVVSGDLVEEGVRRIGDWFAESIR